MFIVTWVMEGPGGNSNYMLSLAELIGLRHVSKNQKAEVETASEMLCFCLNSRKRITSEILNLKTYQRLLMSRYVFFRHKSNIRRNILKFTGFKTSVI
jgi:hypothetical protein